MTLDLGVDVGLGFFEFSHVRDLLPGEAFFEVELNSINVNPRLKHMYGQRLRQLRKTLEGTQRLRLNFILIRLLIKRKSIPSNRCIHSAAEISVVLYNISLLALDINILPGFEHLPQHLDPLPLYLGDCSLFVFSFLKADLLCPLSMLFFSVLLTFNEGGLQQV